MSAANAGRSFCGRTRREFLWQSGAGFASLGLTSLLGGDGFLARGRIERRLGLGERGHCASSEEDKCNRSGGTFHWKSPPVASLDYSRKRRRFPPRYDRPTREGRSAHPVAKARGLRTLRFPAWGEVEPLGFSPIPRHADDGETAR